MGRKDSFLKKQSERVIENKELRKKQSENKPETKLTILLKTIEGPKKQTENKPKNKAGHVVENKRPMKTESKANLGHLHFGFPVRYGRFKLPLSLHST